MIPITSQMILKTILLSLLLGGVSGTIYAIASTIFRALRNAMKERHKWDSPDKICSFFAFDFIFFLSIGMASILLNYLFCDSASLIYSAVPLLSSFVLSLKALTKCIEKLGSFSAKRKSDSPSFDTSKS